jgi:hypothetical protein
MHKDLLNDSNYKHYGYGTHSWCGFRGAELVLRHLCPLRSPEWKAARFHRSFTVRWFGLLLVTVSSIFWLLWFLSIAKSIQVPQRDLAGELVDDIGERSECAGQRYRLLQPLLGRRNPERHPFGNRAKRRTATVSKEQCVKNNAH